MDRQKEEVYGEDEWYAEANFVIQDVGNCVKEITIANLPTSDSKIYFNLTTFEQQTYCIELTANGYRIVGRSYNDNSEPSNSYFELHYSLLDTISPLYRTNFGLTLANKLQSLADQLTESDEVINIDN